MASQESGITVIKKVYSNTINSLKNKPALFVPFIIFAIFESLALILLFLAPRMPLRLIFGPLIRTFWGERFLHYPANFLLLPKLVSFARMGLSIILGSLLTGMAVAIIWDIYNKKHVRLNTSFKSAFKKYASLFIVVFIFTLIFYIIVKIITASLVNYFMAGNSQLLLLGSQLWLGPILFCINFVLAVFIQSLFIYAIPLIIIENERLIQSIVKSFILFKKLFVPTIILVGLPMLIYIPILVLSSNASFLINRYFPEFILLVLFLSAIVTSLIIDPLITIPTTFLYLMQAKK